jgi:hypothetical protein
MTELFSAQSLAALETYRASIEEIGRTIEQAANFLKAKK